MLSILFDDYRYFAFSEPEIGRGYADLCLIVRPELRAPQRFDLLFELKMVRKKALGTSAEAMHALSEDELRALPAINQAFDDAREQVHRYQTGLQQRFGEALNLKSFTIVAVDLVRVLVEAHPTI